MFYGIDSSFEVKIVIDFRRSLWMWYFFHLWQVLWLILPWKPDVNAIKQTNKNVSDIQTGFAQCNRFFSLFHSKIHTTIKRTGEKVKINVPYFWPTQSQEKRWNHKHQLNREKNYILLHSNDMKEVKWKCTKHTQRWRNGVILCWCWFSSLQLRCLVSGLVLLSL